MNDESVLEDALRYRELRRNMALYGREFVFHYPDGFSFDMHRKDNLDVAVDCLLKKAPKRHVLCARECANYKVRHAIACRGYCAYQDSQFTTSGDKEGK